MQKGFVLIHYLLFCTIIQTRNTFLCIFQTRPQDVVHPPRIPSKNEYQRYLHESYQYIVHLIVEQQKIEDERRLYERDPGKKDQEEEDLFANVKKIRAKLRSTDAESIASSR